MMRLRLSADKFLEGHDRNVKRVMLRLKTYLADPNEKNTHDLRTSIRRLEASYSLLPKAVRSRPKAKRFVESYMDFFTINGKVRDADAMALRLARFDGEAVRLTLDDLEERRQNALAKGEEMASDLERLPVPGIPRGAISDAKLQRRFTKLATPLLAGIEKSLPMVVGDERLVRELHRLRIDCKKLRYIMEISADSDVSVHHI